MHFTHKSGSVDLTETRAATENLDQCFPKPKNVWDLEQTILNTPLCLAKATHSHVKLSGSSVRKTFLLSRSHSFTNLSISHSPVSTLLSADCGCSLEIKKRDFVATFPSQSYRCCQALNMFSSAAVSCHFNTNIMRMANFWIVDLENLDTPTDCTWSNITSLIALVDLISFTAIWGLSQFTICTSLAPRFLIQ